MSDPDKIDATMLKDLLASVNDLRSKVVALKSGATGGIIPPTGTTQGGDEPGQDAQLPHGSGTSDINAPPAKKRKENGEESDKEANFVYRYALFSQTWSHLMMLLLNEMM